ELAFLDALTLSDWQTDEQTGDLKCQFNLFRSLNFSWEGPHMSLSPGCHNHRFHRTSQAGTGGGFRRAPGEEHKEWKNDLHAETEFAARATFGNHFCFSLPARNSNPNGREKSENRKGFVPIHGRGAIRYRFSRHRQSWRRTLELRPLRALVRIGRNI